MDVSVIVVNYNSAEYLKDCLDSLLMQKEISFEVILFDNASVDNTKEVLAPYMDKIKVIYNEENLGFGKANNAGAQVAEGKYLYLFNQDAYLHKPDDLKKLFEYMEKHPEIGLLGTRMLNVAGDRETKPRYYYVGENYIDYPYKDLPGDIAWVLGASMFISKKLYEQIGGFDKDYFVYGEDMDICLCVRKAGYEIGHYDGVTITHVGGVTEKKIESYERAMKKQKTLHIFYQKHYSPEQVKLLARRELRRARYRQCFYGFLLLIKKSDRIQSKYNRWRAVSESSKERLRD